MVALEALPKLPELTVEQAEHWIAAMLAEARALRQHDEQLFPQTGGPGELGQAKELHAVWARWADAAEAFYERIRPMLRDRRHVSGAADLDHAIGRTRAMLTITPESYLDGLNEAVISHEEVRRELRDRLEERRVAGVS